MNKKILILFCILSFFLFCFCLILKMILKEKDFDDYVSKYSNVYNLEEEFVYAIIKAESDFQETAISSSGALGLMQIIPRTGKWIADEFGEEYSKQNLLTAETNIKYGCFYLNYLFSKFKNLNVVICAYNAGERVVRTWLDENGNLDESKISYDETRTYLTRVRRFYDDYKNN